MKTVIINIGRQFGSGGKSIAAQIGSMLDIPVYDYELIDKAAEASGLSASLFHHNDEKKKLWSVGSIFGSNRYGSFTNNSINESELFRIQSDTIRSIAESGSAIFVGRASDYVLRDMDCLDVFICAPKENRIQRVVERHGISPEEAASMIEKKDRSREEYYNFFTFGNWGVASNYDLCVDSSILGIEGTAQLIVDFARKAGKIE